MPYCPECGADRGELPSTAPCPSCRGPEGRTVVFSRHSAVGRAPKTNVLLAAISGVLFAGLLFVTYLYKQARSDLEDARKEIAAGRQRVDSANKQTSESAQQLEAARAEIGEKGRQLEASSAARAL